MKLKYYKIIFLLSFFIVIFFQTAFADKELYYEIPEKWEMITNAGFGYTLHFNNNKKSFILSYFDEGANLFSTKIRGKFSITPNNQSYQVILYFSDFIVKYYYRMPNSVGGSIKLTDNEKKIFMDVDEYGYVLNPVLFVKSCEAKYKNKKLPFYYCDLKDHCFVLK